MRRLEAEVEYSGFQTSLGHTICLENLKKEGTKEGEGEREEGERERCRVAIRSVRERV